MNDKKTTDLHESRCIGASAKPGMLRLIVPIFIVITFLLGGFIFVIDSIHERNMSKLVAEHIDHISYDMQMLLEEQAKGLSASLQIITNDAGMKNNLRVRDKEALLADWEPLFKKLNEKESVTHFYFQGSDRINILRVHNPDKNGDRIDRYTTLEAKRTGKTVFGVELGPLGTFTLRVVEPVFDGDTLIGYVELGKEIEEVLEILHRDEFIELAVSISKENLKRKKWENGMEMLGRKGDWERFPDAAVI